MTDTLNRFDRIMHKDAWGGGDPPARTALRDIGDTMYACREWFETYGVAYTGADVVAMASMALKRERELADALTGPPEIKAKGNKNKRTLVYEGIVR